MTPATDTQRPTRCQRARALRRVASVLGTHEAFVVDGRFYFALDGRWFLAVSADDAGRFRIEACYGTYAVATMWAFAQDYDRLASLVHEIRSEVAARVAA